MRFAAIVTLGCSLAAGGCTFGLDDEVSFATRNLEMDGVLADGRFDSSEGTVTVVPMSSSTLANGVQIFVEGTDRTGRRVSSTIEVEGNLGALCPGARVELAASGGRLRAVDATGVPDEMRRDLMGLRVLMWADADTRDGAERIEPASLTLSSRASSDGFSRMAFSSVTDDEVDPRQVGGSFDIARFVDPATVPGWEGDTWNGEPIDTWE